VRTNHSRSQTADPIDGVACRSGARGRSAGADAHADSVRGERNATQHLIDVGHRPEVLLHVTFPAL
jgi:hypothetical protein